MSHDPLAHVINVYNDIAEDYASQWFNSEVLHPLIELFLKRVPVLGSVLDAGCGCGRDVSYIFSKNYDCVGVDLSSGLLREARRRVHGPIFRAMDVRYLDFPDSIFSGLVCFAVLNHFFEEDLVVALRSFARVLRSGGVVALTVKVTADAGYEFDTYKRLVKYYSANQFTSLLNQFGFKVIYEKTEKIDSEHEWLQLLAENTKKKSEYNFACNFCAPTLMPQNRAAGEPIAGSILWGNSNLFATIDCSPLVEGHLLLISSYHHYSTMNSNISFDEVQIHKSKARQLIKKAYNVTPIFLEHGTVQGIDDPQSCIEHAHLHILPLSKNFKTEIEKSLGKIHKHHDDERLRQKLAKKEYIFYEDKRGQVYIRADGVGKLPSQFFRFVIGSSIECTRVKWAEVLDDPSVRANFRATLDRLIPILDEEHLSRPINSRMIETRRAKIAGKIGRPLSEKDSSSIYNIRKCFSDADKLGEIGERRIATEIIYKAFGSRKLGNNVIGDDTAILNLESGDNSIVITTDPCPKPVIFELGDQNYRYFGWLSLVISLSDIAAMGAEPLGALLSCEMPETMRVGEFLDYLDGVVKASERFDCPIVGGNIRDSEKFLVTSTVVGTTKGRRPLRRHGAQAGESIFAIGNMGYFWAAILGKKFQLLLPPEMQSTLDDALTYPEPNLWAAIELSKSGLVGACMDASDGPTGCFYELAERNGVDIVIRGSALTPTPAVGEVARQMNIDPQVLMLTWGNWELIFTAQRRQLSNLLDGHPIRDEIIFLGDVTEGNGRVWFNSRGRKRKLPDLSSQRFSPMSSFTHGLERYIAQLQALKFSRN